MPIKKTIKSAFESMMFVWGEPFDVKIAAEAMGIDKKEASDIMKELEKEYEEQGRGIRIREINGKFQFTTAEENFDYIRSVLTPVKERRLTQAALEVLAIVAYKQPVTKSEIDSIRGIKSDRVIEGLAKKNLIEERGRSNAIGKPTLYGTTDVFLANFDLKNLSELPDIENIEEAIHYEEEKSVVEIRQTSLNLEHS